MRRKKCAQRYEVWFKSIGVFKKVGGPYENSAAGKSELLKRESKKELERDSAEIWKGKVIPVCNE
jgi:hypothetical protein